MIQEKSNIGKSRWKRAWLYFLASSIILMLSPRVAGSETTEQNMGHPKLLSDIAFNSKEQYRSQAETVSKMPVFLVPAIGNVKMPTASAFIGMRTADAVVGGIVGAVVIGGGFFGSSPSKSVVSP